MHMSRHAMGVAHNTNLPLTLLIGRGREPLRCVVLCAAVQEGGRSLPPPLFHVEAQSPSSEPLLSGVQGAVAALKHP